jgi:urease accessory protein
MGSVDAQIHLNQCASTIVRAAETVLLIDLNDMSSTTFELDIAMLRLQRNSLRPFAT